MAVIFKNLMTRLGFEKFYVQGGDWGGIIVSSLAVFFPEKIIGMHSNMCFVNTPLSNIKLALGSYYPSLIIEEEHQHLVYPRMEKIGNLFLETGYLHIQATKPDTVGKYENSLGMLKLILINKPFNLCIKTKFVNL